MITRNRAWIEKAQQEQAESRAYHDELAALKQKTAELLEGFRNEAELELKAIHRLAKAAVAQAEIDSLKASVEKLQAELASLSTAVQELASDFDEKFYTK